MNMVMTLKHIRSNHKLKFGKRTEKTDYRIIHTFTPFDFGETGKGFSQLSIR